MQILNQTLKRSLFLALSLSLGQYALPMSKLYNTCTATTGRKIATLTAAAWVGIEACRWLRDEITHTACQLNAASCAPETTKNTGSPVTIFCHGFGADHGHGQEYKADGFIRTQLHTFDFNDSPAVNNRRIGMHRANLAQWSDIASLQSNYKAVTDDNKRVVVMGVSRGAATALTWLGTRPGKMENVMALELESPFASVSDVIRNKLGIFGMLAPLINRYTNLIYGEYNPQSISPIDPEVIRNIATLQGHIPIFMVCSQQDSLIPASSTRRIYDALTKAGHTKVHLVVTERGEHANIIGSPGEDQYQKALQEFRQMYNLPA